MEVREHIMKNLLYLIAFVLVVVFIAEMIGVQSIPIGGISIGILPLVIAIIITMILGMKFFRRGFWKKVYSDANINFSSKYLIFIMLPLMARYGADVAPNIGEILSIGWVFIFMVLGNLGVVVLVLSIAFLFVLWCDAVVGTWSV